MNLYHFGTVLTNNFWGLGHFKNSDIMSGTLPLLADLVVLESLGAPFKAAQAFIFELNLSR